MTTTNCQCGKTQVSYQGEPLLRFRCHCVICQAVYKQPYADIVLFKSQQITKPIDTSIEFKKHRAPPAVNRGLCPSCHKPVLAVMPLAPYVGLAFIPFANLPQDIAVPPPAFDTFYHRRTADLNDAIPKVTGYWASQWVVTKAAFAAMLKP